MAIDYSSIRSMDAASRLHRDAVSIARYTEVGNTLHHNYNH